MGVQHGRRCAASIRTPALEGDGSMRRPWLSLAAATAALLLTAAPALACGGLIGPNGAVNLLKTTTFAGYHAGGEHYVTAFEYAGGGGAFRVADAPAGRADERREGRRLDAPAPDPRDGPAAALRRGRVPLRGGLG